MEHRKRSQWQHKVQLSTLLKIVLAGKKKEQAFQYKFDDHKVASALATEAIESLKKCDKAYYKSSDKKTAAKEVSKEDLFAEIY